MPEKNFGKNWLAGLPKNTRKMIFTAVIAGLMIMIVSFWLLSLKNILARPQESAEDKKFETIKKDLENFLGETKNYLGEAKNRINQVAGQNGATELSDADIEKLKEVGLKDINVQPGADSTFLINSLIDKGISKPLEPHSLDKIWINSI